MNKLIEHIRSLEKEDKVMFFLVFTTIGNIIVALVKFIFSLTLPSLWFFVNAGFMIVLSLSRFFSIRDYSKTKLINEEKEIKKIGYRNYLNNGVLLIFLGIMYFFVNVYIYFKGSKADMHEYLTYLTALIAFWSIGSAIYGMIKYKRNHTPIIKAVKITNFANALTSIMLTQVVLLDAYATVEFNANLVNSATGMAVSFTIIILGLYMIIGINKIKN